MSILTDAYITETTQSDIVLRCSYIWNHVDDAVRLQSQWGGMM